MAAPSSSLICSAIERSAPTLAPALSFKAAQVARAVADHAAALANLSEIARVAADFPKDPPDVAGPGFGADEIAAKRRAIVDQFLADLQDACHRLRPTAGALRLEARVRLLKRFDRAVDAALSVYDQVICDAPTLLGRRAALPACVACNRPLPTKTAFRGALLSSSEAAGLLASTGPPIPRPESAPAGATLKQRNKHPSRATQILQSLVPPPKERLLDEGLVVGTQPHDDDDAALREALDTRDLAKVESALLSSDGGVFDHRHHRQSDVVVELPAPTSSTRGFRASKRLPAKDPPPPRTGRALP